MKSLFFKKNTMLTTGSWGKYSTPKTFDHDFWKGDRYSNVEVSEGELADIKFENGYFVKSVSREMFVAFEVGDEVEAKPEGFGGFQGEIIGFKGRLIKVENQDGDVFDCEFYEIKKSHDYEKTS